MDSSGTSFQESLTKAQQKGFAEADPTDDIEAYDAVSKLSSHCKAFGKRIAPEKFQDLVFRV